MELPAAAQRWPTQTRRAVRCHVWWGGGGLARPVWATRAMVGPAEVVAGRGDFLPTREQTWMSLLRGGFSGLKPDEENPGDGPVHVMLDHGMLDHGMMRSCPHHHTLFLAVSQSSGLTCANLQTRDNKARHPLALVSNHGSPFGW